MNICDRHAVVYRRVACAPATWMHTHTMADNNRSRVPRSTAMNHELARSQRVDMLRICWYLLLAAIGTDNGGILSFHKLSGHHYDFVFYDCIALLLAYGTVPCFSHATAACCPCCKSCWRALVSHHLTNGGRAPYIWVCLWLQHAYGPVMWLANPAEQASPASGVYVDVMARACNGMWHEQCAAIYEDTVRTARDNFALTAVLA